MHEVQIKQGVKARLNNNTTFENAVRMRIFYFLFLYSNYANNIDILTYKPSFFGKKVINFLKHLFVAIS